MLELARKAGTCAIVATPHANARYRFAPEVVEQRISELSARVAIAIYPGCDFHLHVNNIEDAIANPRKYTINHQRYLLVEFSDLSTFHTGGVILERLLEAGMVPIITHPERNVRLRQNLDRIAEWVASGCYVQVTAGSYTGGFGRQSRSSAYELFRRGLTHFVASDAHDCERRPPGLREAYQRLADEWGEETIRPLFVDNPRAVLEGDAIDFQLPVKQFRRRKWYQFWA
jgi:protein-tyrosine phosphatase